MHVYANNMRLDLTGEIKIMLNILTTILIIIVGIFFILGVLVLILLLILIFGPMLAFSTYSINQ